MIKLDKREVSALLWLSKQIEPPYSFGENDPSLTIMRGLIKKRFVRTRVRRHPEIPTLLVSMFKLTRRGKKKVLQLSNTQQS